MGGLGVPGEFRELGLLKVSRQNKLIIFDRGREGRLSSASPPSEPDVRISRIRLSG